jgi:predicted house-cleaning noncanonical NTP pyrophosphatase (MazG superfamily)
MMMTTVTEHILEQNLLRAKTIEKLTGIYDPKAVAVAYIEGEAHLLQDGMLGTAPKMFYEPPFSLEQVKSQVQKWQTRFDGEASIDGLIAHLKEEVAEFSEDKSAEELADIFFILFHLCALLNINPAIEIYKKLQINQAREWERQEDGKVKHVKV